MSRRDLTIKAATLMLYKVQHHIARNAVWRLGSNVTDLLVEECSNYNNSETATLASESSNELKPFSYGHTMKYIEEFISKTNYNNTKEFKYRLLGIIVESMVSLFRVYNFDTIKVKLFNNQQREVKISDIAYDIILTADRLNTEQMTGDWMIEHGPRFLLLHNDKICSTYLLGGEQIAEYMYHHNCIDLVSENLVLDKYAQLVPVIFKYSLMYHTDNTLLVFGRYDLIKALLNKSYKVHSLLKMQDDLDGNELDSEVLKRVFNSVALHDDTSDSDREIINFNSNKLNIGTTESRYYVSKGNDVYTALALTYLYEIKIYSGLGITESCKYYTGDKIIPLSKYNVSKYTSKNSYTISIIINIINAELSKIEVTQPEIDIVRNKIYNGEIATKPDKK